MNHVKVLLAEDEEGVLEIMGRKIASAGYQVILAQDGRIAWEKIQAEKPDVIVLDINMPQISGWEILKRLRENPNVTRWQPVIIVSSLDETTHLKQGFDLQADHYLTKPCRMDDVLKAIRLMVSLIPLRET